MATERVAHSIEEAEEILYQDAKDFLLVGTLSREEWAALDDVQRRAFVRAGEDHQTDQAVRLVSVLDWYVEQAVKEAALKRALDQAEAVLRGEE